MNSHLSLRKRALRQAFLLGFFSVALATVLGVNWFEEVAKEHISVERITNALQSNLAIESARRLRSSDLDALISMEGNNPVSYLPTHPDNYMGELEGLVSSVIPSGNWFFDASERVLVYRVRFGGNLVTALSGPKRIRFAVRLLYVDENGDGVFSFELDRFQGVYLVPVEPFEWRI